MARGSPKCPNCKVTVSGNSDYCEKCGMRLYFKCKKCREKWFRSEGAFCPRCGERPAG